MSTNSTFFKPNADGTVCVRYHHWDGYPDGLGLFLSTVVDDQSKVDWLFDLKCGFSTIMRSKPDEQSFMFIQEEYQQDTSINWPDFFTDPQTKSTYLSTINREDTWSNTELWAKLENDWAQQYNYIWDNNAWKVVLEYGVDVNHCISIELEMYIQANKMLSDLEVDNDEVEFSWKYFTEKMNCSHKTAKHTVQQWQALPLQARSKILLDYCGNPESDFIEQLDAWSVQEKIQQAIKVPSKTTKKKL